MKKQLTEKLIAWYNAQALTDEQLPYSTALESFVDSLGDYNPKLTDYSIRRKYYRDICREFTVLRKAGKLNPKTKSREKVATGPKFFG